MMMPKAVRVLAPEDLDALVLHAGGHTDRSNGLCAMEVVSWIAGEKHSAEPACTCPVIGAFMRSWNDAIPDDTRRTELLKPLLPRLVGTKSTKRVEQRRADLALDWLVRVQTPAWLDLAQLTAEAAILRALPPLLDRTAVIGAQAALDSAHERAAAAGAVAGAAAWTAAGDAAWTAAGAAAAWDAARAAAGAAAGDAARAAAWAAAGDAAWTAAGAAAAWDAAGAAAGDAATGDAAMAAARAAARAAAGDAPWAAARKVLQPTVDELQVSALDLIDRMIAVRDEDLAQRSAYDPREVLDYDEAYARAAVRDGADATGRRFLRLQKRALYLPHTPSEEKSADERRR